MDYGLRKSWTLIIHQMGWIRVFKLICGEVGSVKKELE